MASIIQESDTNCFYCVIRSKWSDAALITGGVALGVLGGLATLGIFSFLSHTQAAYLSYGLYGGCAALLLSECLKRVVQCRISASKQKGTDSNTEEQKELSVLRERLDSAKDSDFTCSHVHVKRIKMIIKFMLDSPDFQKDPESYFERVRCAFKDRDEAFWLEMRSKLDPRIRDSSLVTLGVAYTWLNNEYSHLKSPDNETDLDTEEQSGAQSLSGGVVHGSEVKESSLKERLIERLEAAGNREFRGLISENVIAAKALVRLMLDSPDFQKDPEVYFEFRHELTDIEEAFIKDPQSVLGPNVNPNDFDRIFKAASLWLKRNYSEL